MKRLGNLAIPSLVAVVSVIGLGWGTLTPTIAETVAQVSSQDQAALDEAERLTQQVEELYQQGKYNEAIPLAEKALAIRKKVLGENHPDTALSLNNLAGLYESQGRYAEAEPLYQQALAINKQQLGENHPGTATSLNNLALLYESQGRYAEAEPLYQQALAITKQQLEENHPDTANSLNNLALLYQSQGRYKEAESIYQDILFIRKKQLGNNHPDTATSLNNLALLYQSQGKYKEAEPLYQEALAIRKKQLGDNHPDTATSLNNLALLYQSQDNTLRAIEFLSQGLTIQEFNLSQNLIAGDEKQKRDYIRTISGTTDWIISLNLQSVPNNSEAIHLALKTILERKGRILDVLTNSLQILRQQINDPEIKELLEQYSQKQTELSNLTFQQEDKNKKEEYSEASEFQASKVRKLYLNARQADLVFQVQQLQQSSQRLADTSNRIRSAFVDPADRTVDSTDRTLQFLNGIIEAKIKTIVFENDAFQTIQRIQTTEKISLINIIHQDLTKIADKISRRSAEFRQLSQPVTLEAIQQQIPANAALVEIVRYQPFNPKATKDSEKYGNPRYAVYILFPNGEIKAKDLGEAKTIEDDLSYFRTNLADISQNGIPQTPIPQLKESARQLDAKLMQPIRQMLGDTKTILLSPDAALNLIPFEALVDENNQYLVENYQITYLTSGRDLLRFKDKFSSQQPPMVLADPIYNKEGEKVALTPQLDQLQSSAICDSGARNFLPLPQTEEQAKTIKQFFPQATVLTGSQATENVVKQVKRPKLLHLATHGFFCETSQVNNNQVPSNFTNPLLRSGLVLAGVNVNKSADDDGVLTALETTFLNLVGTQLVVLSACETGKGDITIGDGVYGLRRALVIAGSESQLISLWQVSSQATKDLMITYYGRLKKGEGRSEALRQTQLEMLKSDDRNHPSYWASFIPSGNWTPMDFNSSP